MREQARAKSAGRELTYAILPGLLLSAQWLRISLISNQPGPPQISHSHTKYYKLQRYSWTGPRLGATEIPTPLRTDAELSEHHRVPRGSRGRGRRRGEGAAGGWMSRAPVEDRTNRSRVEESHRSPFLDQLQTTCVASTSNGVC